MTEEQDQRQAESFFQRPGFNALERLTCSHLIEAINTTPLDAILHTMRAALLMGRETLERLEVDLDEVVSLYTVAQRLSVSLPPGDDPLSILTETLDWKRDLAPWIHMASYQTALGDAEVEEWENLRKEDDREALFHFSCAHLSPEGYRHLVSDFLFHATPRAQEIGGKLATTISPETYGELIRLFKTERRGHEDS